MVLEVLEVLEAVEVLVVVEMLLEEVEMGGTMPGLDSRYREGPEPVDRPDRGQRCTVCPDSLAGPGPAGCWISPGEVAV